MSKLVIVESPAKAKTIGQFLGPGYEVEASFGHIRDLPESAADVPAEFKGKKWGKLGVNVEGDFEPIYIVPDDKKRHADILKKAAKGATELLLATDEDREGESISWHILQLLKPSSKISVKRIVFHEITPEAISAALKNPRDVDTDLVKAQEVRRILDRLYGYTLSPLLWKKVAPKLSAGRVQSVAVRLCVIRERERMAFRAGEYWDLEAKLKAKEGEFQAQSTHLDGQRISSGQSFDPATGKIKDKSVLILGPEAGTLAKEAEKAKPWTVTKVESKPGVLNPPKPFQTSTLQQEAARKLRWPSKKTMQIAQNLYEGIDLRGERVGLITYMRTDSLSLADRALEQAREVIAKLYGKEYLPAKAVQYKTKAKGAQEAHEAIRPTDLTRLPQDIKNFLTDEQFKLYELIWKRTIACQMQPARIIRTTTEIETNAGGKTLRFGASGKVIEFPGYLRAYVEGSDDPEAELDEQEKILPPLKVGQVLDVQQVTAKEHWTMPPARYTEASLIKKLEEEGIGRPSTYVSILSTIQDRGYITKRANELIPTFTAFAVTELLEHNFEELVDIEFTVNMENDLDKIAEGKLNSVTYLREFYNGSDKADGLEKIIADRSAEIPFPTIQLGTDPANDQAVVVRIGRYGAFIQRGEGGPGNTAPLDGDMPPAELTLEAALALIAGKSKGAEAIAKDPESGQDILLKKGRFGAYLELQQTPAQAEAGEKPHRISLPPGMKAEDVTDEDIPLLLVFPRKLGPTDAGVQMEIWIGRFGPFLKADKEFRNIPDWREAAVLTREDAIALLAQPKAVRGRASSAEPRAAMKEFEHDGAKYRVLDGRYGPYVTDGETNATIPKNINPAAITPEQAVELIKARIAAGPSKGKKFKKPQRGKRRSA